LQDEPILAIDTETTGRTLGSKLVSIGFASSGGRADVIGRQVFRTTKGYDLLLDFFGQYNGRQLWHNGQFDTLDAAVGFYLGSSSAARAGTLRNGTNALRGIALIPANIAPLVAFLKSLNEDYQ
jgi:hypothetical protein